MGVDRLEFDGFTATQCAGLVTTKILFNSTVSTPGARFCTFYIKDFYYVSLMRNCEFMRVRTVGRHPTGDHIPMVFGGNPS